MPYRTWGARRMSVAEAAALGAIVLLAAFFLLRALS